MSTYVTPFDPVATPGGYMLLVVTQCPEARRSQAVLTNGTSVGTHLGYMQEKVMTIRWHPRELDVESLVAAHEVDGFVRSGTKKTSPAIDETVNLFNTEVTFTRYAAEFDDFTDSSDFET